MISAVAALWASSFGWLKKPSWIREFITFINFITAFSLYIDMVRTKLWRNKVVGKERWEGRKNITDMHG
jgi:hypothetical protein